MDSIKVLQRPTNPILSRRDVITRGCGFLLSPSLLTSRLKPKRVAGITTVYYHNSHADVILSRLLQGENLDYHSRQPDLQLVSVYVDQFAENDISRSLSRQHGFELCKSIRQALTLGGKGLAVDGVLIIGEHGSYPQNERGQDLYPRKRFFDETVTVFRESNRTAPTFIDKHLSHSWSEAKDMYDETRRMKIPLMAGSSLPLTWRRPPIEIPLGTPLSEAVAVSYHTLYGYGFHALEMLQCMAERRKGGESGVRRVQCLEGPAVWEAGRQGQYDRSLLNAAMARLPILPTMMIETAVKNPTAFLIEYSDGFRASVFTLNPVANGWSVAWKVPKRPGTKSTMFWTQESRPLGHFTFLLHAIEELMHTGRSPWPVERTLLTTGMLDFLLASRHQGGAIIETPELGVRYRRESGWKDPGPPPPPRPLDQQ